MEYYPLWSTTLYGGVHITVMIRWTGLAPWEFEFLFPGSLTSTFLLALAGTDGAAASAGGVRGQQPRSGGRTRESPPHGTRPNVQWFRGGLVFKAHRLLHRSTLGLRVIKKKRRYSGGVWGQQPRSGGRTREPPPHGTLHRNVQRFRGELVFKAHRLCVSLNSRLDSDNEEEEEEEEGTRPRGEESSLSCCWQYLGTVSTVLSVLTAPRYCQSRPRGEESARYGTVGLYLGPYRGGC